MHTNGFAGKFSVFFLTVLLLCYVFFSKVLPINSVFFLNSIAGEFSIFVSKLSIFSSSCAVDQQFSQ
jgi:hypothetical protein